jgi:hypothetical protein
MKSLQEKQKTHAEALSRKGTAKKPLDVFPLRYLGGFALLCALLFLVPACPGWGKEKCRRCIRSGFGEIVFLILQKLLQEKSIFRIFGVQRHFGFEQHRRLQKRDLDLRLFMELNVIL